MREASARTPGCMLVLPRPVARSLQKVRSPTCIPSSTADPSRKCRMRAAPDGTLFQSEGSAEMSGHAIN